MTGPAAVSPDTTPRDQRLRVRRPELAFERRHKSVTIHRRNLVRFVEKPYPELTHRLNTMEIELLSLIGEQDALLYEFNDWYSEESRRYGMRVRPGLVALYWAWCDNSTSPPLDRERYEMLRDAMAEKLPYGNIDGELYTGRLLMQEFIWWSAGEWLFADHLVAAIVEFLEYHAAGRMPDWRRRRRRRLAAAQRRAIKEVVATSTVE